MTGPGLCVCGCGSITTIASRTSRALGDVKGQPKAYIRGHGAKGKRWKVKEVVDRYRTVYGDNGSRVLLHRARAERALGKPLPLGAIVHHADGSKRDDAPLVICPDDAYHQLLHARMRVKAAGGNPNTDVICSKCRHVKNVSEFHRTKRTHSGFSRWCKPCYSAYHRDYLARKKAS